VPPISDRPSSPFQRYYGTDATLLVFTPQRQSWEPTLFTVLLLLAAAGAFAFSPDATPVFCCAFPFFGALLLLVLGRGRLVALAVEREALVVGQKRFIDSDYVTRVRFSDVARVVRGGDLGRNTSLMIETKTGITHEVSFVDSGDKPRFRLDVNQSGAVFPDDQADVRGTIAALCNVLAHLGVQVDVEHIPVRPRWRRRLGRRW
jgi:hypothetical protein